MDSNAEPVTNGSKPATTAEENEPRLDELLHRLTRDEKLTLAAGDFVPLRRLGLDGPKYADGGNGVRDAPGATAFPSTLALAAAFTPSAGYTYGAALADEVRQAGKNALLGPTIDIARVPVAGRLAEGMGEDPYLSGVVAAQVVAGLQEHQVMAVVKHFVANNFEYHRTGTGTLDARTDAVDVRVDEKTLRELYLAPFRRAVGTAGAAAVMTSYNRLNGVYPSQDPYLMSVLRDEWDWRGFTVPDFIFAVRDPAAAMRAGLDLGALGGPSGRSTADVDATLSDEELDRLVRHVLHSLVSVGIEATDQTHGSSEVRAPHPDVAREIAANGMVLLKNDGAVLPLRTGETTMAVVGAAGLDALYTIGGSAGVRTTPTRLSTPLDAISRLAGPQHVTYARGSWGDVPLPAIPPEAFVGPITMSWRAAASDDVQTVEADRLGFPRQAPPFHGAGEAAWTARLRARETGRHRLSLDIAGEAEAQVGGDLVMSGFREASPMIEGPHYPLHALLDLEKDVEYDIQISYRTGPAIEVPEFDLGPFVEVGWQEPDELTAEAAGAASDCDVALVLATRAMGEAMDADSMRLPGDQDALIQAVAERNPRTIVVLNTGGPVEMPWINEVAAVIVAWYPGEQYGNALADVLFGLHEPTGRLPITFPVRAADSLTADPRRYPGLDNGVDYSEGLHVGYHWHAHTGVAPLFPFGHGETYTTFALDKLTARTDDASGQIVASLDLTNTGVRDGSEVVQMYLQYPPAAQQPSAQLVAFERVHLPAGQSQTVHLAVDLADLACWDPARREWAFVEGDYVVSLGTSATRISTVASLPISNDDL